MTRASARQSDGKNLPLVEEFFSIQGEGYHTGKPAWFIRLGGCDVGCNWCDTKFDWDPDIHTLISTDAIIKNAIDSGLLSVVVTGGEPLLWNLNYLCNGLKKNGIQIFLETSGSSDLTGTWDWICLSPKKNLPPVKAICKMANELKVIIENKDDLDWAEQYRLLVNENCHLFLQPEWSRSETVIPLIVDFVRKNPYWRISVQVHKYMKIP